MELWKTDGTAAGTVEVDDLNPGSDSSYPSELTAWQNTLYFAATTADDGEELWRVNGSAIERVADIVPGSGSSEPDELFDGGDVLLFQAETPEDGTELWQTDGTEAGTTRISNIAEGRDEADPDDFWRLGDKVLFSAETPAQDEELWSYLLPDPNNPGTGPAACSNGGGSTGGGSTGGGSTAGSGGGSTTTPSRLTLAAPTAVSRSTRRATVKLAVKIPEAGR